MKPTKHQKHLAEMRERDEQFAAMFGRTSKYATLMTEGHSDDGQGYSNSGPEQGARSLFKQIVSGNAVVGVIR